MRPPGAPAPFNQGDRSGSAPDRDIAAFGSAAKANKPLRGRQELWRADEPIGSRVDQADYLRGFGRFFSRAGLATLPVHVGLPRNESWMDRDTLRRQRPALPLGPSIRTIVPSEKMALLGKPSQPMMAAELPLEKSWRSVAGSDMENG
jgi:hypothetical protein